MPMRSLARWNAAVRALRSLMDGFESMPEAGMPPLSLSERNASWAAVLGRETILAGSVNADSTVM